jgi:citrate synthase
MAEFRAGGLEGVVVADTRLSKVDGAAGELIIAGHDVEALAGHMSFEEVCGLLWTGQRLSAEALSELRQRMREGRVEAFELLSRVGQALEAPDAMEALRACAGHLPEKERPGIESPAFITSALSVFGTAWMRRQAGKAPMPPDPSLSPAQDAVRMARGEPHPELARALDAYWVTVSDHGMNASTFTARVVASTGSDLASAIVAGICALKGPLHGGAPGPVLDMLDAIGAPDRARTWMENELHQGRRIMGMGHRIYRVRDPRAAVLEKAVERLEAKGIASQRLKLARAVETAAESLLAERHPDRPLKANVEFYTAVVLEAVGIPRAAFSTVFAMGRVAGWCGHVLEQRATGRLIRPESRYIGPAIL